MLRPSGVSSASEASWAASANCSRLTPWAGRNSVAWRSPRVIVPVLSSSSTSTSPAASAARPLMASTFFCTSRSIPAMPMALKKPADRGGNQANQQRRQDGDGKGRPRHRCRRTSELMHHDQKDDGQGRQKDRQGDLVGGLLALGPFDQFDHVIEETLARVGRYAERRSGPKGPWCRR